MRPVVACPLFYSIPQGAVGGEGQLKNVVQQLVPDVASDVGIVSG